MGDLAGADGAAGWEREPSRDRLRFRRDRRIAIRTRPNTPVGLKRQAIRRSFPGELEVAPEDRADPLGLVLLDAQPRAREASRPLALQSAPLPNGEDGP
jgi:hypothetical protein